MVVFIASIINTQEEKQKQKQKQTQIAAHILKQILKSICCMQNIVMKQFTTLKKSKKL